MTLSPIVILVRPQLGENIGAVARAMANFGLPELRLVAPRDGWPNPRAFEVSSGATHILEAAKTFDDFASALADTHVAYATTARPRDMEKRVVTPAEAAAELLPPPLRGRVGVGGEISSNRANITPPPNLPPQGGEVLSAALVFGPERTGLENDEIALCDALITIPTAPDYSSLNLAQSVVVVAYEWFSQCSVNRVQSSDKTDTELRTLNSDHLATKAEWLGLFDQLESYLDETNYYRVAHKKTIMWQNLLTMLLRGRWTSQEIQSFRGMLRVIWERKRKGPQH